MRSRRSAPAGRAWKTTRLSRTRAGSAGLPDENGGFVWLDLEDGLPLVLGFADLSDEEIPPQLRRNLEPLRWLVAWADRDGRTSTAELFLAID